MSATEITSQQMKKGIPRGDELDDADNETANPRPRQGEYPVAQQPTPLGDSFPTGTAEGDAGDSDNLDYLSPRLNDQSGNTKHDDILSDPNAAADRRDQPRRQD